MKPRAADDGVKRNRAPTDSSSRSTPRRMPASPSMPKTHHWAGSRRATQHAREDQFSTAPSQSHPTVQRIITLCAVRSSSSRDTPAMINASLARCDRTGPEIEEAALRRFVRFERSVGHDGQGSINSASSDAVSSKVVLVDRAQRLVVFDVRLLVPVVKLRLKASFRAVWIGLVGQPSATLCGSARRSSTAACSPLWYSPGWEGPGRPCRCWNAPMRP